MQFETFKVWSDVETSASTGGTDCLECYQYHAQASATFHGSFHVKSTNRLKGTPRILPKTILASHLYVNINMCEWQCPTPKRS